MKELKGFLEKKMEKGMKEPFNRDSQRLPMPHQLQGGIHVLLKGLPLSLAE